ncbi:MAG: hypothetical protein GF333_04940 [Candidatus Omnitrophica bacterium]|nr:hypothetical protein [Candidatus Omnitrophota bacterium]
MRRNTYRKIGRALAACLCAVLITAGSAEAALVSWWKFDDGAGTSASDSQGSNTGTLTNGPTWSTDLANGTNSLSFDSSDSEYVEVSDSSDLDNTSAFTITAWVKPSTLDGNARAIVSKRNDPDDNQAYSVFFYTDDKLYVDVDGTGDRFSSDTTFSTDQWYHIAVVYDGSLSADQRVKVYVDGALDTTASETSASIADYSSDFYVGIMNSGYTDSFDGIIDEVKYYDSALTATEVSDDYELTEPSVSGIDPATGEHGATESVTISGSNFLDGASVTLTKAGESDIDATGVTVVDSTEITCDVNLTGAAYGSWNVVVANNTGQSDALTDGFSVYAAGLVAWWKFDDGSGSTAADSQGPTYDDGTVNNASWTFTSARGDSLYFNGSNANVAIPDSNDINVIASLTDRTIVFWFKAGVTTGRQVLWEEGGEINGISVYIDSGTLYGGIWGNGWTSGRWVSTSVSANTWYHVVLRLDDVDNSFQNDKLKLFVNTTEEDSAQGRRVLSHPNDIGIGQARDDTRFHDGSYTGDGYNFEGYIDEVKIYNSSLSTADIQNEYELTKPNVTNVTPSSGEVDTSPNVTISGENFHDSAEVTLTKSGESDITGSSVTVINEQTITCTFDLTGAALGQWNVVVENPTGQSDTLSSGYRVVNLGMVSWWRFEDGSGSTAADSADSNPGTLQNTPTWTTSGAKDDALSFDESSTEYVEVSDNSNLDTTNQLTLMGWVYPTTLDGSARAVISKRDDADDEQSYSVFFYTDDHLYVDIDGNGDRFASNYTFNTDEWRHIAVVYDGTLAAAQRVKIYVDGTLDTTSSESSTSIPDYASDLYLGIMNSGYSDSFDGTLDEIKVYAGALTQTQVEDDYELTEPSVLGISPDEGIVGDTVSVTISGVNFGENASAKLAKAGESDINGSSVSVVNSATITCDFDLTGAAGGDWNVVVTNNTGQEGTLTNGFFVKPPMSGTYTVKTDGSGDYTTILEAVQDLNDRGVQGATTIDVYSGTYTGQVTLEPVVGASAVNTITIREAAGETAVVDADGDSYGWYFDGADYFTIHGFEITDSTGHGIYLENDATNNSIEENYIHDVGTGGGYAAVRIGADSSDNCDGNEVSGNRIDGDNVGVYLQYTDGTLVVNNMVYGVGTYGLYLNRSDNGEIHFNSLYLDDDICIYKNRGNTNNFSNNAMHITSASTGDYCFYNADGNKAAYPFTSDYNDLYAPNGANVGFYGGAQNTLAHWQAATAEDANSISTNPFFTDAADLHIQDASPCQGAGNAVGGIAADYDGDARGTPPDIGADENLNAPPAPLSGTYTVQQGGGGDYTRLIDVVADLEYRGVAAPGVTIDVYTGTYMNEVTIEEIPGASAANPVVIRQAAGENAAVEGSDYAFHLDGADYVTIEGFDISNTNRHGVYLSNYANYNTISKNYIHNIGNSGNYSGVYCDAYTAGNSIVNNMILGDYYGIYLDVTSNTDVYFNSVYHTFGRCLRVVNGSGNTIENNVLLNTSTNAGYYCIYAQGSGFTSDYNDFYAPAGASTGYYGGAQSTLANWQAATGQDANSIALNPQFVSSTDLHIQDNSPCQGAGNAVAGVSADYDGDARGTPPDIGADENLNPAPAKMSGTYTVKQDGSGDYLTIIAAVSDLEFSGVSGAVTIDVYSGTYMGQVDIAEIAGVSAVNTIIIQEAAGESVTVEGGTYVFYLDGADYITLDGFDITNCSEHGILLENGAGNNVISGNYIYNVGTSGNYTGIRVHDNCDNNVIRGNEINGDLFGMYLRYADGIQIYNNMIYNVGNYGVYLYRCDDTEMYFNSLYLDDDICLYRYQGTNGDFRNNIMHLTSGNSGDYCFYARGDKATYTFNSDYNNLYAPAGATIGYYAGAQTTLSDWQAATSEDANSLNENPFFVSGTDLHIQDVSGCQGAGVAIGGYPTDYDGDSRATPPDIGADENLNPPPAPMSGTYTVKPDGSGDYLTIVAAVSDLESKGVSGVVTVDVYSGTYMSQVDIGEIPGASAANTVTIQEASGETVTVEGNTYVFHLDGTDYLTVKGFDMTNVTQDGVFLENGANNNTIEGNNIYNIGTSSGASGVYVYDNCDDNSILGNEIDGDNNGIYMRYADGAVVANNLITGVNNYGIYLFRGDDAEVHYNSVSIDQDYCFRKYQGSNHDIKNNIFYNYSTNTGHYCMRFDGDVGSYPFTSDYNDIYAPNGANVAYYGGVRATLSDWQGASGQDANSISQNPQFVAVDDLHIEDVSPCQNSGTALAGYTADFEGDARGTPPDIGADENLNPPPVPMSGTYTVKQDGSGDYLTIVAAVSDLEFNGVNGPVIIDVYSGTYMSEVAISEITGAGSSNTVTFKESAGETVVVEGDTYGFYLDGADYIVIEGFEITGTDEHGIFLENAANNNVISNNYIHDVGTTGGYAGIRIDENCDFNEVEGNRIEGDRFGVYLRYADDSRIHNNMISDCYDYGIYIYRCDDIECNFNSVYIDGDRCLYKYQGTNGEYQNNVLYNYSSNSGFYCFYNADGDKATYSFTSDYNDLYAPVGANIGYYGSARVTLNDWQTATAEDANSISQNPQFTSSSDLHIQDASPCQGAGTALAGYTDDYDGDARADPPDIGADENPNPPPAALSGTYTVKQDGSGDYLTIVAAVSDLESKGVSGAVTIDVYSGTYMSQVDIGEIPGASAANTIAIQEASGETVVVEGNIYVFFLDGTDYLTLSGFEITNADEHGIYLTNGAQNNIITENYIHSVGDSGGYAGVYLDNNCHDNEISNNRIDGDRFGVYMQYSDNLSVYNNMITGVGDFGLYINRCDEGEFYFNSIHIDNDYCIYKFRGSDNDFQNNILSLTSTNAGDYCFYNGDGDIATYPFTSDYNDFYAPYGASAGYYNSVRDTLSDWQSATSQDANSISTNPYFASDSDLHLEDVSPCQGAGISAGGISDDYDGDARAATPDIGADENLNPPPAAMSGTYTVKTDGSGDYLTIIAAVSDLESNGVNGAVTVDVYSGTYTGQVDMEQIPGASAANTIIIQEASGESVEIDANGSTYIWYLDDTDYVTIRGFEMYESTQHGVYLTNFARYNTIEGNYIHDVGAEGNYAAIRLDDNSGNNTLLNNMILSDYYGVYLYQVSNVDVHFNSISNTFGRCIHKNQGSNNDFQNNILSNTSANANYYCFFNQDGDKATYSFTSDYNDFYAPNGVSAGYYGSARAALADWQTATAEDANSISGDPQFGSPQDLHIGYNSACQGQGTAIGGISGDYDGDSRAATPDIGADENTSAGNAMSGTYTVKKDGSGDYLSIGAAVNDLEALGVSGAVTIDVYSGTYAETIDLSAVTGAGAANTITIQEASGENVTVDAEGEENVVHLDGADYITIQGFELTDCTQDGVLLDNAATDNTITGNYLYGTGTGGNYSSVYIDTASNDNTVSANRMTADRYGVYLNSADGTVIDNNMIADASYAAIYMDDADNTEVYYNSIRQEVNRCIYKNQGTNNEFRNNAVFQVGNNLGYYCFFVADGDKSTYTFTSNYNDFYAPNARVGYYGGAQASLSDWQTATSEDANSISSDPDFLSSTNLHISNSSSCLAKGAGIAGFTTDFDGEARGTPPDIGADENLGGSTPMSGVYTVIAAGGGNYTAITQAASDLNDEGVSGWVRIDVYDGMYSGQVNLEDIPGASSSNTIAIREFPGEDVTVDGDTYGFYLSDSDYVTIDGFEITSCTEHGIYLDDYATNNTIQNNYIHTVGTSGNYAGIRVDADCDDNTIAGNEIVGDRYGLYLRYADGTSIYNNMIYDVGYYGVYIYRCDDMEFLFNSIDNDGGRCLYKYQGANGDYRNNILSNTSTNSGHYCFYNGDGDKASYSFTSDYNDFYVPSGASAGYYGGAQASLADWQTATAEDANSLSKNPRFTAADDLHIQNISPCQGAGISAGGISDDYDGDARAATPDIGADENLNAPPPPMSGSYTINQDGSGDYTSFSLAVDNLDALGVSGAVTFDVYDDGGGTYTEEVEIPEIVGAGSSNTITFREAAGESVLVNGDVYGFYLNGADYVIIEDFEITSCTEHGVYMTNGATNNILRDTYIYDAGTSGNYASVRIDTGCHDNEVSANTIEGDYYGLYLLLADRTQVYNNMIYEVNYYGIYMNRCDDTGVYFNSVYSDIGRSLYKYRGTGNEFQNNILYNNSTNSGYYCFYNADGDKATYSFSSDYNDLYAPNGASIGYYGSAQSTLGDWQTATSEDANSISQNPLFTSTSDLHIADASPCQGAGTSAGGVSDDYDDDARAATPDIGADENTNPPPPPMSGNYTIKQDGTGDYTSFSDAVSDLNLLGVGGAVVFDVYDDGGATYPEEVELSEISGASAANTITFQEAAGESVAINGDTYAFYLNGADYVTIQGFDITSTTQHGIYLTSGASNNVIEDNYLYGIGSGGNYAAIRLDTSCDDNEIAGNEIDGDYYGVYLYFADGTTIYNNMIYGVDYYGVYMNRANNTDCYFNSISNDNGRCIQKYRGTGNDFQNNVLYNSYTASNRYCFYVQDGDIATYPFTADYNDMYAPNGASIGYYGSDQAALSDWQTATGQDANSISQNPRFTAADDLHIADASPCQGAGTSAGGISDDFDGDARAATPDIGADENTNPVPPPMSGNYTINQDGSGDYTSFTLAVADLELLGVGGAVIFDVYDDGGANYVEEVEIGEIAGASSSNTITFREAAGESVLVNGDANAFYFDGADYITLQGFTITSTSEEAVYLVNGATNNVIKGNYFYSTGSGGNYAAIRLDTSCDDNEIAGNEIDGDYYGIYMYFADGNKIYNNMIYNAGNYGVYLNRCDNTEFYFNSIRHDGDYCLRKYRGLGNDFQNNVFANVSTNANDYCLRMDGAIGSYPYTSDYNDFYTPSGAHVAYNNGSDEETLADWQAATGQDANSIDRNPRFTAADDLHIADASPCQGAGISAAGISDDFDGDARAATPDIGADENTNPVPPPMSGGYTINQDGTGDYTSFALAVDDLEVLGVNGAVTFDVYDDGGANYVEEVEIGPIAGASAANTITFREAAGETVLVNGDQYAFFLDGADYIRLEGFDITSTTDHGVYLTDGATNNVIRENYIYNVGSGGNYAGIRIDTSCDDNEISGNEIAADYYGVYLYYADGTKVYNNMIYDTSGYGAYIYRCDDTEFYFNSIYMAVRCVLKFQGSNNDFQNNILYNHSTNSGHYCFYNQDGNIASYPFTSDYNDMYAPNGASIGYYGGVQSTLSDWQTATGQDANSFSSNPLYTSTTDLHIGDGSPCQNTGTALAGYSDDYDGDARADPPDIGADENLNPKPAPLSGTYTIKTDGSGDYVSFTAAVSDLVNRGVGGAVTFDVYSGTYVEEVSLEEVNGASSSNTITFQEALGETVTVNGSTYGFDLNSADFITIQGFDITSCTEHGIYLHNYATNNVIDGNYISGVGTSGNYANIYLDDNCNDNEIRNNTLEGDRFGIYFRYSAAVKVYNNMIYGMNGGYGIYLYRNTNAEVYYNSVSIVNDYCIYNYQGTGNDFQNNIMSISSNSTGDYCFYSADSNYTSDYNDFYAPNNAQAGRQGGSSYAELSDWVSGTGQDANSISRDPQFTSSTDLHIQDDSLCQQQGNAIAGYTTDFDGDARADPPDIGADENLNALSVPLLEWVGDIAAYTGDGLDPEIGGTTTTFSYRVRYTHYGDQAPDSIQVHLDENGLGAWTGYAMLEEDPGDTDYSDGKIYYYDTTFAWDPAGVMDNLSYYFTASEGGDSAVSLGTDPVPTDSSQAINAPDITKTISILITDPVPAEWNIPGIVGAGETVTMDSADKITIENDGDVNEQFSAQLTDPAAWSSGSSAGNDIYVMKCIFCGTSDVPGQFDFASDDVATTSEVSATSAIFAGFATNAESVPAGEERALYLQFVAPNPNTEKTEQTITVTIGCAEAP